MTIGEHIERLNHKIEANTKLINHQQCVLTDYWKRLNRLEIVPKSTVAAEMEKGCDEIEREKAVYEIEMIQKIKVLGLQMADFCETDVEIELYVDRDSRTTRCHIKNLDV